MVMEPERLEVTKLMFEKLRSDYLASTIGNKKTILVLGTSGSGKTSLLATAPKPVLIHSFDPHGTRLATLKPLIERGEVIVDERFENEDPNSPTAYNLWNLEMDKLTQGKVWSQIGTYALDSSTTFGEAAVDATISLKHRAERGVRLSEVVPTQRVEYPLAKVYVRNAMRRCATLPCHSIVTGHLEKRLVGEDVKHLMVEILMPGQAKIRTPMLFEEVYVILTEETSTGLKRWLLTEQTSLYDFVRTRMGAGIFNPREPANLSELLKKAGCL